MSMGIRDVINCYGKVKREALWQAVGMYEMCGKPLNGIKRVS